MMEHNGSIGTKQSRIRLMEKRLNSYGDKVCFFKLASHTTTSYQQRMPSYSVFSRYSQFFRSSQGKSPTIESLVLREKQYPSNYDHWF